MVVISHIDTVRKFSGKTSKISLHKQGQKAINKSSKKHMITEHEILLFPVKTDFQKESGLHKVSKMSRFIIKFRLSLNMFPQKQRKDNTFLVFL